VSDFVFILKFDYRQGMAENKKGANNQFAPQTQTIINQRNIIRTITFLTAKLHINCASANIYLKKNQYLASVAFFRINVEPTLISNYQYPDLG